MTRARWEYVAALALLIALLIALIPAITAARAQARDDARKNELASLRRDLEQYFNKHESYPNDQLGCTSIKENYTYCVTDILNNKAMGYYLETSLEVDQEDTIATDEDEQRKYDYRVLHEQEKTLYRVCGGSEMQCKPVKP